MLKILNLKKKLRRLKKVVKRLDRSQKFVIIYT